MLLKSYQQKHFFKFMYVLTLECPSSVGRFQVKIIQQTGLPIRQLKMSAVRLFSNSHNVKRKQNRVIQAIKFFA